MWKEEELRHVLEVYSTVHVDRCDERVRVKGAEMDNAGKTQRMVNPSPDLNNGRRSKWEVDLGGKIQK